jgi:hypothetical protein
MTGRRLEIFLCLGANGEGSLGSAQPMQPSCMGGAMGSLALWVEPVEPVFGLRRPNIDRIVEKRRAAAIVRFSSQINWTSTNVISH